MKKVVVASKSQVKLDAAEAGFKAMFPDEEFEFVGLDVVSGVKDQPSDDLETKTGAMNRVSAARKALLEADYWIGIEGGIEDKGEDMEAFAWVIVNSKEGKVGKGRTGMFLLPPPIAKLIREGKELGEADDIVFGRVNSKTHNGAVGLLTKDVIHRRAYYVHAISLALIPFKNPELY